MSLTRPTLSSETSDRFTSSMWDWLLSTPRRKALSRLRWKVLQRGELVEHHWSDMRTLWLMDKRDNAPAELPESPTRLLSTEESYRDPNDGTIKWRLKTHDGHSIETVLIPAGRSNRATACVSSQVGCGVSCSFCATGRLGMLRSLSAPEILEQLLIARQEALLQKYQLRNVVFMGMGEPLHNWTNVQEAIHWMLRDDGFYISPAHLCVSTAGVLGNLRDCARKFTGIRLAISLHSCDPEVRRTIVPRGVGSLEAIRQTIVELNFEYPDRKIWLEIVMLSGVTDRTQDIEALLKFCEGLKVEINLIPYNQAWLASEPESGDTLQRSEQARIWDIAQQLRAAGYFTTIRHSGGQNIAAACGQLAANNNLPTNNQLPTL